MRARCDRDARHARRAERDRRAGGRAGPAGPGLRVGPLVLRLRADRRRDDPTRPARPSARLRLGVGPVQGRGRRRAARPEPDARRTGRRVREPGGHRQADGRGLDLDRDARHRRALPERLRADRGARAGHGRRVGGDGRRIGSRAAARGAGRPRRARRRLLGDGADRPGVHAQPRRLAEASGRDPGAARRAERRRRPLRVLRLPPHRRRPLPGVAAHRRAARASEPSRCLRAGGDARELGRAAVRAGDQAHAVPGAAARPSRRAQHRALDEGGREPQGVRVGAPHQVHGDGVRGAALARTGDDRAGARARAAGPSSAWPIRSRSGSSRPTTPS